MLDFEFFSNEWDEQKTCLCNDEYVFFRSESAQASEKAIICYLELVGQERNLAPITFPSELMRKWQFDLGTPDDYRISYLSPSLSRLIPSTECCLLAVLQLSEQVSHDVSAKIGSYLFVGNRRRLSSCTHALRDSRRCSVLLAKRLSASRKFNIVPPYNTIAIHRWLWSASGWPV